MTGVLPLPTVLPADANVLAAPVVVLILVTTANRATTAETETGTLEETWTVG
jgi:hypothetical protein